MNQKNIIVCDGISKSFGGVKALDNVTMQFENQKITGIIGGNGAGKTSLFNIITGFSKTDKGKVYIYSQNKQVNITNKSCEKLANYGMVRTFQHIRLFNEFSVYENVLSGAISLKQKDDFVKHWLKMFDIYSIRKKQVKDLPYGTRRLIEMARCLATGAKIIFLDEIGAGMTTDELNNIANIIIDLNKDKRITFIVIEHNMEFIKKICGDIYAMDNGKILMHGKADDVINSKEVIQSIIGA